MFDELKLADFLLLSKTAKRIAVYKEIAADQLTPVGIVENLAQEMSDGVLLESVKQHEDAGHYSFLAFGKLAGLTVENNVILQQMGDQVSVKIIHRAHRLNSVKNVDITR